MNEHDRIQRALRIIYALILADIAAMICVFAGGPWA